MTQARLNAPNAASPSERATWTPTAKLVMLEAAWSASPQESRPTTARRAVGPERPAGADGAVRSPSVPIGVMP